TRPTDHGKGTADVVVNFPAPATLVHSDCTQNILGSCPPSPPRQQPIDGYYLYKWPNPDSTCPAAPTTSQNLSWGDPIVLPGAAGPLITSSSVTLQNLPYK